MIQYDIYEINEFPSDNGLSDTLIPAAIVQGLPNKNYDKLTIDFRS